jgi:hypothetical protein
MVKSDKERSKAYRRRQAVRHVAEQLFGGETTLTLDQFFEGVNDIFDEDIFNDILKYCDSETEEHVVSRDEVYSEAYEDAYKEAYQDAYNEYLAEGDDEDDADEGAKDKADESAKEEAGEAVDEWESSIEDYANTCVEYALEDLVEAYREAHSPLL